MTSNRLSIEQELRLVDYSSSDTHRQDEKKLIVIALVSQYPQINLLKTAKNSDFGVNKFLVLKERNSLS